MVSTTSYAETRHSMTPRTPVCVICVKGSVSDTTLKGAQRELNQSVNTRNKVARPKRPVC